MTTTAELAAEREALVAEIENPTPTPAERLKQVDAELDRLAAEAAERCAVNHAAYVEARDDYVAARDYAIRAAREYVARVEAAVRARRKLVELANRDGARPSGEVIPEPFGALRMGEEGRELRKLAVDVHTAARSAW
jgi:hypothetical protein